MIARSSRCGICPAGARPTLRAQVEAEGTVLEMRKPRDVQQAEAQTLLQLVQQSTSFGRIGRLIDVRV